MSLSFTIAKRYLFSKKSHNAINLISMVSVCGIAVATSAMVCTLSVFNGFHDVVQEMFGAFDPELKITPAKGKIFDINDPAVQQIAKMPEVAVFSECLTDNVLVKYGDKQMPAIMKGVPENFHRQVKIDSIIIGGTFVLSDNLNNYVSFGVRLANDLGVSASFIYPVEICAPIRNEKVNMANPAGSFSRELAYISSVFMVNQPMYDDHFLIVPISLARDLLRYETAVSSIELKLKDDVRIHEVQQKIREILGDEFLVKNRYEQQDESFRMMNIEKWMTFMILFFILTIAIFNVISSLSLLIIEKGKDIVTLRNLGASSKFISRIFLIEGWMIPVMGGLAGMVIGLFLCLIQEMFGLIKMGESSGIFVVDAYPVRVAAADLLYIFITVVVLGFFVAFYPVKRIRKQLKERDF
ncbi:MAG: ABC transporter permease [Dysgonamonadaceae bacterium]|jgi:lipoprotein-releasing system permease protein/zinc transport system substrate-binding protein|nr:ABC transporter permease [Dysgonamonadaceae bacterium]